MDSDVVERVANLRRPFSRLGRPQNQLSGQVGVVKLEKDIGVRESDLIQRNRLSRTNFRHSAALGGRSAPNLTAKDGSTDSKKPSGAGLYRTSQAGLFTSCRDPASGSRVAENQHETDDSFDQRRSLLARMARRTLCSQTIDAAARRTTVMSDH